MVTNIGGHAHILCGCWEFKRRFDCVHSKLVHPQIYFPSSQVLFISEALTPVFWSLSSALLCYHSALNPFQRDQARMLLFPAPSQHCVWGANMAPTSQRYGGVLSSFPLLAISQGKVLHCAELATEGACLGIKTGFLIWATWYDGADSIRD